MTRIRGRIRSKLINIDLEFDVKTLKTGMMENEKKSTVGGLFSTNTSSNNISYHQQTGSLFSTYPEAATPTETSDHYSNDGEDCVGRFSFGNNKPTSRAFAAAKPTTTSHLFSQSRPRLVEESFGWSNSTDCTF